MATTSANDNRSYKMHWHVVLTHFPISLFGIAFGFQVLHLFVAPACFELATNVSLILATATMIPVTMTGWVTWKTKYKGAKVILFRRKIFIAFAMLAVSVILTIWRVTLGILEEVPESPSHWIFMAGNLILISGAIVEGYFGGRLNHK